MTQLSRPSTSGTTPPPNRSAVNGANNPDARLLTLGRVAELLSVSRRYVDGLIAVRSTGKARLRTVREGVLVRVTRDDLDSYVATLRQEAGHPPLGKRSA